VNNLVAIIKLDRQNEVMSMLGLNPDFYSGLGLAIRVEIVDGRIRSAGGNVSGFLDPFVERVVRLV